MNLDDDFGNAPVGYLSLELKLHDIHGKTTHPLYLPVPKTKLDLRLLLAWMANGFSITCNGSLFTFHCPINHENCYHFCSP